MDDQLLLRTPRDRDIPCPVLPSSSDSDSMETVSADDVFILPVHHKIQPSKRRVHCTPLGWVMIGVVTSVCMLLTSLYTMNYTMDKSIQWLKTLAFACLWHVFIGQCIKILLITVVLRCLSRGPKHWDHIDKQNLQCKTQSKYACEHNFNT